MDIRSLFLAETCALTGIAVLLWVSRSIADERNGLRTWTLGITCQAIAYLLLTNARWLPATAAAVLGNLSGALSVALCFVAIRRFAGRGADRRLLAVMVMAVTVAAGVTGSHYVAATIFNGFAYAGYEWLNAQALWRPVQPELARVQRMVALFYVAMGIVLPVRALALLHSASASHYLDGGVSWDEPIHLFGFVYIVVTNLGFVLMCKTRAELETRLQARTDELTGLANRRALDEEIALALASAQRTQRPFAVVMADVDRFKSINDRFGHATGDATLASFARRLRLPLRGVDRAFRYGGEEFCLLLPDTDVAGAAALAERARACVALAADESQPALTASFGIAAWRPGDAVDALFGRADRALYAAKRAGRDRVEIG